MTHIIKWPVCTICNTKDHVFRCRLCNKFTCNECVTYSVTMGADNMDVTEYCTHEAQEPIESDGWIDLFEKPKLSIFDFSP